MVSVEIPARESQARKMMIEAMLTDQVERADNRRDRAEHEESGEGAKPEDQRDRAGDQVDRGEHEDRGDRADDQVDRVEHEHPGDRTDNQVDRAEHEHSGDRAEDHEKDVVEGRRPVE